MGKKQKTAAFKEGHHVSMLGKMEAVTLEYKTMQTTAVCSFTRVHKIAVENVWISHVGGQLSERLAPAPTHSKQQCVAQRLPQDAADTAHMFNGIHEEYKFYLGRIDLIVVFHVFIHHFHQL